MTTPSALRCSVAALLCTLVATLAARQERTAERSPIRVGLIGLDTSHAGVFTQLLNDASRPDHVPGARVVAAFKGGSPDIEAMLTRIEKFTADLRDTWKIEVVDSIDELLRRVDAVMLTSVDGRVHLTQARPVLVARKPVVRGQAAGRERARRPGDRPARGCSGHKYASLQLFIAAVQRRLTGDQERPARVSPFAAPWRGDPARSSHTTPICSGMHRRGRGAVHVHGRRVTCVTRTHSPGGDVVMCQWTRRANGRGPHDSRRIRRLTARSCSAPRAWYPCRRPPLPAPGPSDSSYYGLVSAVVEFFKTGTSPVPLDETLEIMAFMEAADQRKSRNGAPVAIAEILK